MSAPDLVQQTLWRNITMLDWRTGRYMLRVFNPTTQAYQALGGGGGGEPLVLGGSDPADFLLTDDGDIIMVEDNRG